MPLCPKRHADPDFIRAPGNQVRHYTVKTESGDQRRQQAKETRKFGHQALAYKAVEHCRFKGTKITRNQWANPP